LGNHHTLSGPNNFWIERVTANWNELNVTWNNQPPTSNVNRVSMPASTSPTENYLNTNVTQLIKDMISQNNFGFMLRLDNEDPYRAINFCSSDHTNPNLRPKLSITYSLNTCKVIVPTITYGAKGNNITLTASSNAPGLNYTWQTNPLNNGWQNVIPSNFYAGTNSNTLSIFNIQLQNHLQAFRVISSKVGCTDTSSIGKISITDTCLATKFVYDTIVVRKYDTVVIRKVDTSYITVTDTLLIKVKVGVSNSQSFINTVKVYPNPTSSFITIDYGKFVAMSGYTLRISNSAGKVLYASPINQQQSVHNLSDWGANGLYFIQIIDTKNAVIDTKKIILH
jgi:Secretion system C-terminal sorting domain